MPRGRPRAASGARIKGVMTAYACFVKTCREEHKKLHPDENVQFGEFAAQCSQRWKTMSEKEKEKFHEMSSEDKERYAEQMKDYVPPPGTTPRGRRRRRGSKKERDPNKPKRALSAFFYYAKDERGKVRGINPDFSVGEVAKELGRQWNELTEGAKAPYEKSAEEDRARYDTVMKIYRAGEMPAQKKMKTSSNGHPVPVPAEGIVPAATFDDDAEEYDEEDEDEGDE
uniref:High mobility group protein DSP1-like n=1 Tax=Hirondellea gigas TaxID=1518452 RepID=A0A2P2I090_9CRUS